MKVLKVIAGIFIALILVSILGPLVKTGNAVGGAVSAVGNTIDNAGYGIVGAAGDAWRSVTGIFSSGSTTNKNTGIKTYDTAEDLIKNTSIYSKGFHRGQ